MSEHGRPANRNVVRPIFESPVSSNPAPVETAPVAAPIDPPIIIPPPVAAADTGGPPPARLRSRASITALICTVLLGQFFILAALSSRTKNATYDENFHVLGAWSNLWQHDYRVDPDNFTLWSYWAALPQGAGGIIFNRGNDVWLKFWHALADNTPQIRATWSILTLYRTVGNDADAILNRSRMMMLFPGVALGALMAWWGYKLAGPVAAVAAAALFAFDPNFLGHSPLVKNDVPLALVALVAAVAAWRAGQRANWRNLSILILAGAAAANIKVTGILVGPVSLALLGVRALLPGDWDFLGRTLSTRIARIVAVAGSSAAAALAFFVITWACYGFRFAGTNDPDTVMSANHFVQLERSRHYGSVYDKMMPEDLSAQEWPAGRVPLIAAWAEHHHLLPQAWLCGIAFSSAELQDRPAFLCGEIRKDGWWYYFPLASLFKLPFATLMAMLVVPALMIWTGAWKLRSPDWLWPAVCVFGAAGIYLLLAMISHVNLGVRHIFHVYALAFVGLGWLTALVWKERQAYVKVVASILLLVLAVESWSAYPDYIAFFNFPSGGSRGGIRLLGDANLDWGQDMKNLAKWSHEHPAEKIYLAYLNLADPYYYKLEYTPILVGYPWGPPPVAPTDPGILAIEANSLQGTFIPPQYRDAITRVTRELPLIDVIGGSIYLYRIRPAAQ